MSMWPIARFSTFTPHECRAMLATERVGRLVVAGSRLAPRAVHYALDGETILLGADASDEHAALSALCGMSVRLEVEHYEAMARAGWNVVAGGVLEGIGSVGADNAGAGTSARLRVRHLRGRLVLSEPLYPSFRLDDPAFV